MDKVSTNFDRSKTKAGRHQVNASAEGNITIRLSDLGIFKQTADEMELQIRAGRILSVLTTTIDKLKVCICLPSFLKNDACLIRRYLKPHDVEFVQGVCLKYKPSDALLRCERSNTFVEYSTIINSIARAKGVAGQAKEDDDGADPLMAHVIELLWNNLELREKAKTEFKTIADKPSKTLIEYMNGLQEVVKIKLKTPAKQRRNSDKNLKRIKKKIPVLVENITRLKKLFENQGLNLKNELEEKQKQVAHYIKHMDELNEKFKEDVQVITQDSEKLMGEEKTYGKMISAELLNEIDNITSQYDTLLLQHINLEKILRGKKIKVESQLDGWLKKFDKDVGKKQAEYDNILAGYENEKAVLDVLQVLFDEQEVEYERLVEEKEENERKIFEKRLRIFKRQLSAKKIQRWYRNIQRKIMLAKKASKKYWASRGR